MKLNLIYMVTAAAAALTISSCTKKFDPSTYAPELSIGGYTSAAEISAENLVAYWAFDDSLVDSVSNQSGTATGTSFTAGLKGKSLQGANNSYVVASTPGAVQNLKSFTVSLWTNSPQNTSGIVGLMDVANGNAFWGNLAIFFENGATPEKGVLKVHVNNDGKDAWLGNYDLTSPWDKWVQIAVSYDQTSSTFKVYVNGSRIATQVISGFGPLVFQDAQKMVFGTVGFQTNPSLTTAASKQDWASYMTGRLDQVRIYNKALTDEEISSLQKLEGRGK